MRTGQIVVVAVVVLLAGCGGLATGDNENATGPEVEGENNVSETNREAESETEPKADLRVSSFSIKHLVRFNESQTGNVVVKNTGDVAGSTNLTVQVRQEQLLDERVTLDPGESIEYEFNSTRLRYPQDQYVAAAALDDDNVEREFTLDHPSLYGKTNVTLFVDDEMVDRNVTGIVRESTTFWEKRATDTVGYPVKYELVDQRAAADQILHFEDVAQCGDYNVSETAFNGCADTPSTDVGDSTINGSVQYNLSNSMMERTTTHELGHMLGLEHDDQPQYVMRDDTNTRISPNTTKVAFRSTSGNFPSSSKREAAKALDHLADSDVDTAYGFRWEEVSSPEDADLVITHADGTCSFDSGGGSCVGEPLYDGQPNVVLDDVDKETTAWHTGYQFAPLLFDETPDGLSSDTDRDEREDWPR